ncbi:MAG TPA: hypothetical protein VFZ64_04540 [Nocardioidaceae bacterium]
MTETPQAPTTAGAQVPPQAPRSPEETTSTQAAPTPHRRETRAAEPTGWVGWVLFGAMMMIMLGSFQAILGLTALFKDSYYVVAPSGLLVDVDYTAWGWTHLALGALAIAAGVGLLAGQMWARVVGIAMALVSAMVNLAFIAAYPLWSTVVIALDVLVIYAIAMHGQELEDRDLGY